ncbi:MAG TPA: aminotransferase class III-fold pyridoxal phosphate-dependent enzyme [Gemmataceae bacterium]|nr:aminotransferase class III-fold pyridoxal phosphate-dependent enzyme [Gemmataceae bacterium]
MQNPLHHSNESASNQARDAVSSHEPRSLRTYTPTQAVLARSAGVYHWTPEGRRLYDFTSGVLVANLGHNPVSWMERFVSHMGWPLRGYEDRETGRQGDKKTRGQGEPNAGDSDPVSLSPLLPVSLSPDDGPVPVSFFSALPMTAYNAVTEVETQAIRRLVELLQSRPGGKRLEQVFWAASGSEAIQKALWAALARDPSRPMIIATRFGFHGKKGLAGAVTGCETDHDRDPRVRFISFPMAECADVSMRERLFDDRPYRQELESLGRDFGHRLSVLITEPYLGGGGSYHPPKGYLQLLQEFCRENDIVFILDEVQSNFGRTGAMFAFETYGLEPDMVVLGKGLGNGVPVAAAVGRADVFATLDYGEGSDTWSANPLCCAAVLATLDEFGRNILGPCHRSSAIIEEGLIRLKQLPFVGKVRGEKGGMVWGLEMQDHAGRSAADWANATVLACYRGLEPGGDGIHFLGPLAKKVIRIAPPLVISETEAHEAMQLMYRLLMPLAVT